MNVTELSELLNDLPDQMIVSAYRHSRTGGDADIADAASAPVPAKSSSGQIAVSHSLAAVPRWTVAAVLAACLLFAVGFGAIMMHGNDDALIPQNSPVDSMLEEVTAATASAQTTAAGTETVTTQRTAQTDTATAIAGTTQPVTAAVTSEAALSNETDVIESAEETETSVLPESTETASTVTEPETTTAVTSTTVQREPHKIMQMTSAEEVEREGSRMVGEYARRIAELNGKIDEDAPRITTAEVVQMVEDGMDFRAVLERLHELYPYPDYIGGSGVTNIEYWLDRSGTDFILLTIEQETVVHIVHDPDGTGNVFDILNKGGKP